VNSINSSILLQTLSPLVSLGYHPVSLKVANGVVLNKPGKPSYESPSSFRIIVLLRTVSKILERIIATRLLLAASSRGLIHPDQCRSLPGLRTYDACLTVTGTGTIVTDGCPLGLVWFQDTSLLTVALLGMQEVLFDT